MKTVLIVILFYILTGCTITKPHVVEYRIAPNISTQEVEAKSCQDNSLKIAQVFTQKRLMSRRMRYVQDGYKEFSYTESGWSNTPNKAISANLLKSIRTSNIFTSVNSANSRSRSDFLLETNVEQFLQFYAKKGTRSYVEVTLSFTLVNLQNSSVVDSVVISEKAETTSLDARGGVLALNKAFTQALEKTNTWLSKVCK